MDYRKMKKEELIRLLEAWEPRTVVTSPKDAYYGALKEFSFKKQEHFIVLLLNGAHEIFDKEIVSVGLLNKTLVHPREVFSPAIEKRACCVVLGHNHPSGQCNPSEEDISITNRLVEAGKLLGVKVLDHIIVSPKGYYSFLEHSLIGG